MFVIRRVFGKGKCHQSGDGHSPEEEAGAFPADDEWISWITGRGGTNERHYLRSSFDSMRSFAGSG